MGNWIKNSFENINHKTSSKRVTGFWFVVLTTLVVFAGIRRMLLCDDLPTNYLYFLLIMLSAVLLLFMVITVESLIELVKAVRNSNNKE